MVSDDRYQSEGDVRARYVDAMGEDLGSLHFELWKECVWLHTKWSEFQSLFAKSDERVDVLNRAAPAFFFLCQKVLIEDIMLHLARLTDPPQQGGNLNVTVRAIPAMISDEDLRAAFEAELAELLDLASFARSHRNKRLAHLDMATLRGEASKSLEPATRDSMNKAITKLAACLNVTEAAFLDSTVFYDFGAPGLGNADVLVRRLAAGLYLAEQWNERLRKGEVDPTERRNWNV